MSLSILRHLLYSFYSSYLYVLSSKFNWKPVFKLQINRAFLPTTPNRTARSLYFAYNHLVFLCFTL